MYVKTCSQNNALETLMAFVKEFVAINMALVAHYTHFWCNDVNFGNRCVSGSKIAGFEITLINHLP